MCGIDLALALSRSLVVKGPVAPFTLFSRDADEGSFISQRLVLLYYIGNANPESFTYTYSCFVRFHLSYAVVFFINNINPIYTMFV